MPATLCFICCDTLHTFVIVKYYGSIADFTSERNADLMRAYRQELAKAGYIVATEIFERIARSPSSRFWVSEKRAAVVISAMEAGRPLRIQSKNKREMFEEIYRRYLIARKAHPRKSLYDLVSEIVNQPAPKFYFTPRTIGEFIYRIKEGWYDKRYDRYRDKTFTQ